MTTKSDFKNFAVLTVDIRSVEQKTSKEGKPYAVASATLPMEARSGASHGDSMPLRIVALNGVSSSIAPGQMTLVGRLGYDEGDKEHRSDGKGTVVFFPTKVEPAPGDGKLRNYVNLTLRAGQDAEGRYSESGNFWAHLRMVLSQGKDANGNYKPSLWLTVKGFTSKEGDEAVPHALDALQKGALATISGRLVYEVSHDRGYLNLMAFKVETFQPAQPEAAAEQDCPY